jgi:hypothetical protein
LLDKSGVLGEGHKGSVERFNRGGASRNERGIDDLSCARRRAWMGAMPNKTDRISLRTVRRAPSPKGKDRCRWRLEEDRRDRIKERVRHLKF